jgi:hypothetical protein
VRGVSFQIAFDPELLEVESASVAPGLPPLARVTFNIATPGLATVTLVSPSGLPAGLSTVVHLQTNVPTANPGAIYGRQQVLDVHSLTVVDSDSNSLPVLDDDALHHVTFFADVSGNGRLNARDASLVARVAALLDGGFVSAPHVDPIIVGDVSGNGRINSADASRIAQAAALIDVPGIPPIPAGVIIAGRGAEAARARGLAFKGPTPNQALPLKAFDERLWDELDEDDERLERVVNILAGELGRSVPG